MSCSTSVTSLAPSSTAQLVRRVRGATPRVVARDATTAETAALFEALCQDAGVPYQKFVNRTDLACGSTIGPLGGAPRDPDSRRRQPDAGDALDPRDRRGRGSRVALRVSAG